MMRTHFKSDHPGVPRQTARTVAPRVGAAAHAGSVTVRRQRHAFTLMETMLALALAAVLMGGIYAAMDQSWRLTSSGHDAIERVQLARALIHKISLDVRSITYVPPPPTEDTSTDSSTTSGTTTGTTQQSQNTTTTNTSSGSSSTDSTETGPNSKSVGLRGTATTLEISIARPRRDLLPGSGIVATGSPTSDLRQVTYSFTAGTTGLIRTEGDRMAVEVVEAAGSTATQVSAMQSLVPELTSLTFRYFDGRVWSETWDSDVMLRIPRAVEVTFSFPPPRGKTSSFMPATSSGLNNHYRTVILIPVSDPYPPEFLTQ